MKNSTSSSSGREPKRRIYSPAWLNGIIVALLLTFVLGFYLPATDANETHSEQFSQLSEQYKRIAKLHGATTERLSKIDGERKKHQSKLGEFASAKASAQAAVAELKTQVESSLSKEIKTKIVSVAENDAGVIVSIEGMYLIYPHQIFVHARGERLLCRIAQAIGPGKGRSTEVVAHANGATPASRTLERQFPTSWQLSGVLAADVAEKLQRCGMAGTDLRSVGAAHHKGDAALGKKSPARFELLVRPSVE